MRRTLAVLLALPLISAAPAQADDEHRRLLPITEEAPWMTGAQLLQNLGQPAKAAAIEDYIKGVYDATEHREWCHAGPNGKAVPKPRSTEIQAMARAALEAMPAAQLKRSAAVLLVESWQEKWPCPPDGCCNG